MLRHRKLRALSYSVRRNAYAIDSDDLDQAFGFAGQPDAL